MSLPSQRYDRPIPWRGILGPLGGCVFPVAYLVEVREPLSFPEIGCHWRLMGEPRVNEAAAAAYARGLRGTGYAHVRVRPVRV